LPVDGQEYLDPSGCYEIEPEAHFVSDQTDQVAFFSDAGCEGLGEPVEPYPTPGVGRPFVRGGRFQPTR